MVEPNWVLLEDPALSLQTTQRLVLWATLKAQWSLRCEARFQGALLTLDDFVACWVGVLEVCRAEKDFSLSRMDLQQLREQLYSWFAGGMFMRKTQASGVYPARTTAAPLDQKEKKWGQYRDSVVRRLALLEEEGWTLVYTDGSSKQVRGWWQVFVWRVVWGR